MVQPVLKRGCDKTDPSNYRPISIVSAVAKVFEKCINQHIVKYLEVNKLISDRQYGFRESRSTTDLLTCVTDKWNLAVEQFGEAFAIALDISKAFDKVWHENLICKIVAYGIDSITVKWIKSFLKDRKISVVLNGSSSPSFSPNAGVPQGSVLSPTLFLLYINDLLDKTVNPIHCFADDATLHSSISFEEEPTVTALNNKRFESVTLLNLDLKTIFEWGAQNLVKFNENKTQVCTFSRKKNRNEHPFIVNNHVLESCDSIRLLGVQLSSKLKWNEHIIALVKSASQKLGFLNRCRRFFNAHQVLQIYKTFIRPCIEYCCQVWGGAAGTTLQLLDRVQRRAIRIIRSPKLTKDLDSLQHRRDVAELCVFYRCMHGRCSTELSERWPSLIIPTRATRGSTYAHRFTVKLPKPRTEEIKRNFIYRTSKKWNSLKNFKFPEHYNMKEFKAAVNLYLKDRALGAEAQTVTMSQDCPKVRSALN